MLNEFLACYSEALVSALVGLAGAGDSYSSLVGSGNDPDGLKRLKKILRLLEYSALYLLLPRPFPIMLVERIPVPNNFGWSSLFFAAATTIDCVMLSKPKRWASNDKLDNGRVLGLDDAALGVGHRDFSVPVLFDGSLAEVVPKQRLVLLDDTLDVVKGFLLTAVARVALKNQKPLVKQLNVQRLLPVDAIDVPVSARDIVLVKALPGDGTLRL